VLEGVPPGVASRSMEPAPASAPAPAPAPAPASAPASASAPARALVASSTPDRSEFTPSMQLPPPVTTQRSTDDAASVVQVLLEQQRLMHAREEKIQAKMEAKAKMEMDELRQEMEAKVKEIEEKLAPVEAISEEQVTALQARLEAVHAAKLLSDDELYSLEDMVVDYVELEALMGGVITLEMMNANENARKLLGLVAVSEAAAADGMFARQARRKYV
jgi:hypothetical protein